MPPGIESLPAVSLTVLSVSLTYSGCSQPLKPEIVLIQGPGRQAGQPAGLALPQKAIEHDLGVLVGFKGSEGGNRIANVGVGSRYRVGFTAVGLLNLINDLTDQFCR